MIRQPRRPIARPMTQAAIAAERSYIAMCVRHDDAARQLMADGAMQWAAETRKFAAIAYRAPKAERVDPVPS